MGQHSSSHPECNGQDFKCKKEFHSSFWCLISKFLAFKGVPKKNSDVLQKIRNLINTRTFTLSTSHVQHAQGDEAHEDLPAPAAQVQGEQQGPPNQVAQLAVEVQGLRAHMDERFDGINRRMDGFDGRFTRIDETLVAILSRLGNQ